MDKKTMREKLSRLRGNIISDSTVIERALAWRLRTYFFPKTNRKAAIFYWYVINTSAFRFETKISLYENIPDLKKSKRHERVMKALRFIQARRNQVAHWDLNEKASDEKGLVLYNPTTLKEIKFDDSLLEEFREHEKFLLKVFGWTQTLREKYG